MKQSVQVVSPVPRRRLHALPAYTVCAYAAILAALVAAALAAAAGFRVMLQSQANQVDSLQIVFSVEGAPLSLEHVDRTLRGVRDRNHYGIQYLVRQRSLLKLHKPAVASNALSGGVAGEAEESPLPERLLPAFESYASNTAFLSGALSSATKAHGSRPAELRLPGFPEHALLLAGIEARHQLELTLIMEESSEFPHNAFQLLLEYAEVTERSRDIPDLNIQLLRWSRQLAIVQQMQMLAASTRLAPSMCEDAKSLFQEFSGPYSLEDCIRWERNLHLLAIHHDRMRAAAGLESWFRNLFHTDWLAYATYTQGLVAACNRPYQEGLHGLSILASQMPDADLFHNGQHRRLDTQGLYKGYLVYRAQLNCAVAALAALERMAAGGQLPADGPVRTSGAAVAGTVDPFTGAPLLRTVEGAVLTIYSVGPDGVDDRGAAPNGPEDHDRTGDVLFRVVSNMTGI
ncbi:MAG: hypothetical protein HYV27_12205 [Candidatus Hydrogenedentes bacterium]|nr:hypothetical protein [Candidatus Hydrogenedentota bacterium]